MFESRLQHVLEQIDGALAVSLVGQDGIPVESAGGKEGLDLDALAAELLAQTKSITDDHRELDVGEVRQFSVTTDTIFSSRKLPLRDLLAAIAIFVNDTKSTSISEVSRDLGCQYKTAFALAHSLRKAATPSNEGP